MRVDALTQCRRAQGDFHRHLGGMQPRQGRTGLSASGQRRSLLSVRNAAQLFTLAVLAGTLAPAAGGRAGRAVVSPPATRASGYAVLPMHAATTQAAAAATGCIARPGDCTRLVTGAALIAAGSYAAGVVTGWRFAPTEGCVAGNGMEPRTDAAALSAAAQASEAAQQRRNDTLVDALSEMRFRPGDLDPAQDPCASLHAYVNSRWANVSVLPADQTLWHASLGLQSRSVVQQLRLMEQLVGLEAPGDAQRVVADLWASGMDAAQIRRDGLRPLRAELAAIDAIDSPAAVAAHLRWLSAEGRNPVFGIAVEPDVGNRTTQIAYIQQGGLGLPSEAYYEEVPGDTLHDDYRAHIAGLLELSGVDRTQAQRDARRVFALEQRLAAATPADLPLRADISVIYNPVSAAQADALTPNFSWTALFESLGAAPPDRFSLATPDFHRTLDAALVDDAPAVWRAYLRFHCLDMASPYLDDRFVQAGHRFEQRLLNRSTPLPPRWERVLAAINAHAGPLLGEAYARAWFPASSRARIGRMVEQMRFTLKHRLGNVTWLEDASHVSAQARVDQLNLHIGHPDHWPDWSGLDTERCGYLRNLQRARAFQQRAMMAGIGQPADPQRWRAHAHEVRAYFDVLNNNAAFSAALLQPPNFDPQADDALNYGAIGAIIGHEMSHAFSADTSGFALDGGLRNGWSDAERQHYHALSAQLAAQFDLRQIDGLTVDGTRTAGENMADLGGLTLALDALHQEAAGRPDPMIDGLSREQRFFISWAVVNRRLQTPLRLEYEMATDPHSFGAPRTDVVPSNMPAYAAAFHCPPGAPMARSGANRVQLL